MLVTIGTSHCCIQSGRADSQDLERRLCNALFVRAMSLHDFACAHFRSPYGCCSSVRSMWSESDDRLYISAVPIEPKPLKKAVGSARLRALFMENLRFMLQARNRLAPVQVSDRLRDPVRNARPCPRLAPKPGLVRNVFYPHNDANSLRK